MLSLLPTVLTNHYAVRERYRPMQRWLVVATVLGLASCVLRGFEFPRLVVRWDENAYGSILWVALGLHTTHILSGVAENLMMLLMLARSVPEKKHFSDVQVSGLLWYFVVGEWVIVYPLLYWGPVVAGR
jgi:heme/copper-type cytochrome/quinol oxidase subunit 3